MTSTDDRLPPDALFRGLFDVETLPDIPRTPVTAVVLTYNEARRIPHFLDHHAALGVGHFIVIDNGSTDDTAALLDADPRVTRIFTARPYSEHKAIWREAIADALLADRWVLFPDVDELLVFPGWPERSLPWYCDLMERREETALFTTMIDMYPDAPLSEITYAPGQPFLDVAPWFDTGNYRLVPLAPKALKAWPTPPYRVFGGARERLFSEGRDREPTMLDRLILKTLFGLGRGTTPGPRRRRIDERALRYIEGSLQELSPPNMSKVPLVRWKRGTRLPGGLHRLSEHYSLSADWGALLHFKYLDDFAQKTEEAVERAQHAAGAAHYRLYAERMERVLTASPRFRGSRRFATTRDLERAGLMRVSAATARSLAGD